MENTADDQIVASLHQFLLENYPRARQTVLHPDDRLIEKGIVDSLGLLTLIGFLEATFGIQVLDADVTEDNFASLRTLAVYVKEARSRPGPEARRAG